ncbi:hypothetical protein [Marinobacter sp.]|uniref:hypothetical protein n=1 Tax=Marinobacter sp. TaxID=50741 RepID=UPI003A95565A
MNGRNAMGLSHGFLQGFQVMNQYQQGKQRMALAEQASERADQRHQWDLDDRDRLDDQRLVQAMHQGVESGQIDPKIAMEFGNRFDVDWSNYVDPEFGSALGVLESTVQGQTSMKSPEFNQAFERVFRTEINKGTGEEYDGPDGAHRLEQKRLAGVYPGPDGKTLMVDLEVLDQGPNGPQWRRAPVTKNRSAKDDEVHAIPLEAALDKLKGHQIMYQSVQASPQLKAVIQQYAARTGAQLPKAQTSEAYRKAHELQALGLDPDAARNTAYGIKPNGGVKGVNINGFLVDPRTGATIGDFRTPDQKTGRASGKAPADVQTAEWLVEAGIAPDNTAAWNMLSMARSDPSRFVSSYVTQAMKAQEMLMPDEQKSQDELVNEAMGAYQTIMARAREGRSDGTPAPAGLELLDSHVQVLPQDGSAVPQPDGSYSGQVNRSAGLSIPAQASSEPSAAPASTAPNEVTPEQIKAAYKAGQITKEQAIAKLKAMGFE